MEKWEYMVIRIYGGAVMLINGQEVGSMVANQPVGEMQYEYLNRMGEEGWEVSGMAGVRGGTDVVLKRPFMNETEEEEEEQEA